MAQGFKWWQTERFQKELGLSPDQVTRIEGIYQAAEPLLRAQRKAVDKNEKALSKTVADPASDEAVVLQAIDRLEAARSEVSRTRNLMFFRIRRVLGEELHGKMQDMYRRDREEHEKSERERRNKPKGQEHSHPDCH